MGLSDTVQFAGYVRGDDYVALVASFDVKVFLVPGSDGTCRAVREALALGVPVVASRRGMLPELVRDGRTGVLVGEEAGDLAAALEGLAGDRGRLGQMAREARQDARERFDLARHGAELRRIYSELV
jgi:glycosyltransferase involved in cell wall biosynthesis